MHLNVKRRSKGGLYEAPVDNDVCWFPPIGCALDSRIAETAVVCGDVKFGWSPIDSLLRFRMPRASEAISHLTGSRCRLTFRERQPDQFTF